MSGKDELLKSMEETAEALRNSSNKRIAVLTHYDADGLAAGGALVRYLSRRETPFTCRATHDLSEEVVADFTDVSADLYVFLDLGTGQIDAIRGRVGGKAIIIDHHQIQNGFSEEILMVNPELNGIDGGRYGCASVLASLITYLASRREDDYLLRLGIVGMVGDMQCVDAESINDYLITLAKERKVVETRREFTFFAPKNMPLHKAISWSNEPYIPGLSGREDKAVSLIASAGVPIKEGDRWRRVDDLSEEEKRRIVEEVVKYTASIGAKVKGSDFLETVYEFPDEKERMLSTAAEFSYALSACGRMGRNALGLLTAAGRRGPMIEELRITMLEKSLRTREMMEGLEGRMEVVGRTLVVDGRGVVDERFVGTSSNILSRSPIYEGKVVLVFSETSKGDVKISGRVPVYLTEQGFNLGRILSEEAEKLGGSGGGHKMAAGATIPPSDTESIRAIVDRVERDIGIFGREG